MVSTNGRQMREFNLPQVNYLSLKKVNDGIITADFTRVFWK